MAGEMMDHAAKETFPRAERDQAGESGPPGARCRARGLCLQNVPVSSGLNRGAQACFAGQQGNEEGLAFNLSKVYCVKTMIQFISSLS